MSADGVVYLDSSALVKLVVREEESDALIRALHDRPTRVCSALCRVEVVRAVAASGPVAETRARRVLSALRLLALDEALLDAAARLPGSDLRGLDAIHVASALALGDDLDELITYDGRMAAAAEAAGVTVAAPAD